MRNRQPYLGAFDFDGTLAATFEDSPNGMNVHVASGRAIAEIFGVEGIRSYDKFGGLKNREPGELVTLIQNDIGRFNESSKELTECFVQAKLSHLVPEISPEWPQLYPGVKELFRATARGEIPMDTAIISSGHDFFIRNVFEVNGIPQPTILVTSDFIRSRDMPKRGRYKPNPHQLAEAHRRWEEGSNNTERYVGRTHDKPKIIYVGDSPEKDGGLAEQARIPFIFVPFTDPDFEPRGEKGQLLVPDLVQFHQFLKDNIDMLTRGESFSSILFGKKDTELFPPPLGNEGLYRRMFPERQLLVSRK